MALLFVFFSSRFSLCVFLFVLFSLSGGGPLQFTPVPFALDCVLNPLGEWGDEGDDRNDDGIEALLMSLSIAQPGSFCCLFCVFLFVLPYL